MRTRLSRLFCVVLFIGLVIGCLFDVPVAVTKKVVVSLPSTLLPAAVHIASQQDSIVLTAILVRAVHASLSESVQRLPVLAPQRTSSPDPNALSVDTAAWACIRWNESRDTYSEPGGGAYQFEDGTWQSVTGLSGAAQDYSAAVQDQAALKLYAERGWEPWTTRWVCGLG